MPIVPPPPTVEEFYRGWAQEQVDAIAPDCTQAIADAIAPLNQQIADLTDDRDGLQQSLTQKQQELDACNLDLQGTQATLTQTQADLAACQQDNVAKDAQIVTLQDQVTDLTNERDALVSQVSTLTAERDQLLVDLAAANDTITTLTAERDTALSDLGAANIQIADLEQQLADCQTQGGATIDYFPEPNIQSDHVTNPWFNYGGFVAIHPRYGQGDIDVSTVLEEAQLQSTGGLPWVVLPHGICRFEKDGTRIYSSGKITGGIQAGKPSSANGTMCDYRGPSGGTLFQGTNGTSILTQFGMQNIVIFATNDIGIAINAIQPSNSTFFRDMVFRASGRKIDTAFKFDNKDSLGIDGDDNAMFMAKVENIFFNNGAGRLVFDIRGWVNGQFHVIDVNNWLQVLNHERGNSGQSNGTMLNVKHHNIKEPIDASCVLDNMNGNPWTFVSPNVQHTRGVETFVRVINDSSRHVAFLGGNKTPEGQNNGHPNLQNWIIGAGETVPAVDGETIYYPNPLSAEAALALQNL